MLQRSQEQMSRSKRGREKIVKDGTGREISVCVGCWGNF